MAKIIEETTVTDVPVLRKKRTFEFKVDAPLNKPYTFRVCRERVKLLDGELVKRDISQDTTPGNEFVPVITKQLNDVLAQPATDVVTFTGIDGSEKTFEIRDIAPMLIEYFELVADEAEQVLIDANAS